MFKRIYKLSKDYFSIINLKNKYLILFIIVCLTNIVFILLIPYYASLIITHITEKSYNLAIINVLILALIYFINKTLSFTSNNLYAKYFKNTYVYSHKLLVDSICEFGELQSKEISHGKIINTANIDLINIAEIPSLIFETVLEFIKLFILYIIFLKNNFVFFIYVFVINMIYYNFSKYLNDRAKKHLSDQRKWADSMTSLLSQIISALKDIKSLGISNSLDTKMNKYRTNWEDSYYKKRKCIYTRNTYVTLIIEFGKILLYLILIYFMITNRIELALLLLLLNYYDKTKDSINDIISNDEKLREESISFYRIKDILSLKENKTLNGIISTKKATGIIEFKNVSFNYSDNQTLKNISFKIPSNTVTTLVGQYGSGKTTIFNLLLKLYKVDKGKILIDDISIYDYKKESYNSLISVVNQKTFMFNLSIRENLSLVNSNKQAQIEACKKVGLHNFIMSLKDGYNTILKENATNLSGGQKQLLTLARVLLLNPKIILFDEVTSALDPKTTNKIFSLIKELKENHTIIIITHNKEVMRQSDNIIVLRKGTIAGKGKHRSLMKKCDEYRKLNVKDV